MKSLHDSLGINVMFIPVLLERFLSLRVEKPAALFFIETIDLAVN